MKKSIYVLFLILSLTGLGQSGTINFETGNRIRFNSINGIRMQAENCYQISVKKEGLQVKYENTIRSIPYDKIQSIRIQIYEVDPDGRRFLTNGKLIVITKTGVELDTPFCFFGEIYVKILDDLTGEIIEQRIESVSNNKLNFRSIRFD